ncbi:hypothetical protein HYFRA_00006175 [Hymenoscyphus fraxineus]|uniref:Coenzyme Q-binding protein COQ10 START domain-containing protein n=1 Tax=Hymenoscyphus fraxineus TaxID=746836 RepID=A0A9N9LBQ0_9HELO|nr:hypothetical protein HYFRA_00006175 [Hymenoscyphus fraxineus]
MAATPEPTTMAGPNTTTSSIPTHPIAVPTHGAGGSFTILAATVVPSQDPLTVMNLIRDIDGWPRWNTFCPHGKITSRNEKVQAHPGEESWLKIGDQVKFDVHMSGDGLVSGRKRSREQEVEVTVMEEIVGGSGEGTIGPEVWRSEFQREEARRGRKGWRVAWKGVGWSYWQMHSERVMEFYEDGEGGTEYLCWETFGGVLGPIVRRTVGGQLVDRFGDYASDVRGFFESPSQ